MAWTKAFNSQGPSGAQLRTGSGAPAASLGAVGDTYIDTTSSGAPIFYGAKTASGWPSSGTSLVGAIGNTGAAGSQITYGTAVPGPPYTGHAVGDVYLRSTGDLYQLTTNGWTLAFSLLGPAGPQGASVRSGSGAPSSSLGNVGDVYVDTTNSNLYGAKTSSGWPTTYTSLTGLTGASGGVIRSGTGAPSSSLGNVGDVYIDLTVNAVTLYGNKTTSGWPSSGTSLVGTAGLSVLTGSGAPSSSLGAQNQAYVDTTNAVLYVKGATAWSAGVSIVGIQGVQGLSVLTGSGPPSSSIGATSQAYLDYTNSIIYVKTSSGWPSTGTSLVGVQGPASPSIVSGSGAPTAAAVAGSFYIRTDTSPNYLYGPYTTANGWPTSYTAMGGGTFQTTSGPPASSLGSVGDCAFDLTNALFYPPKTSSGWTATPINMVGPTGPTGQVQPTLGTFASAAGPACLLSNVTTSSTAIAAQVPGLSQTCTFVPTTASAFTGGTIVNYTATGASLTFTLYDVTAAQSTGYSVTVAKATVQTVGPFAATTYPLTAGHQYVWNITGSSASYCTIQPNYLYPSTWSGSIGAAPTAVFTSAALSTTAAPLQPPGLSGQYAYYANPGPSFLYAYNIVVSGSGSAQLQFYNATSGAIVYTTPSVTATTAGTLLSQGPFGVSAAYIPASAQMYWRIIGSGTCAASVNFYVCQ